MKEIITLQFGPYANYIGSHYWNLQVRPRGVRACCPPLLLRLTPTPTPLHPPPPQDELFGPAYMHPALGGELDSDVLYRTGEDAMVRGRGPWPLPPSPRSFPPHHHPTAHCTPSPHHRRAAPRTRRACSCLTLPARWASRAR